MMLTSRHRAREEKRGSEPGLRLDPNAAAVALDNLLANRESQAASLGTPLRIKPVEHFEDRLLPGQADADSIILSRKFLVSVAGFRRDSDFRRAV